MNAQAYLTPISRKREFLDWWINDTHLGYCVAHWVGKRRGEKSLQVLIDPAEAIPRTPLRRPMAQTLYVAIEQTVSPFERRWLP